jgi:K+-sensing histidine kinase KdpD
MENHMKKFRLSFRWHDFTGPFTAVLLVSALTALMLLIGKDTLGDAVIALLYLVPITWCTTRWGQVAGIAASYTSAMMFNYFFIPPTFSFTVGSLEGWLILIIFMLVSVVVLEQIQSAIKQARQREHEAVVMYELVSSLTTLNSRKTIASTLAEKLQQQFQARQVHVTLYKRNSAPLISWQIPADEAIHEKPTRTLFIQGSGPELAGDIAIWQGEMSLPAENSWLLESFVRQTTIALERVEKNQGEQTLKLKDKSI